MKLERAGNTFTASQSADGSNWTVIGSITIDMASSVYIGLAVTSHNNSVLTTAILDNVVVNTGSATAAAQASATLTSGAAPLAKNFTNTASATQTDTTSAGGDALEPALIEAGEIEVDHEWQRVTFTHAFVDPVVVAKPLSNIDSEPAVVRIDNVDATGFDIRLQEWDYLDGLHALERVGYLVMERGSHVLTDGTRVEADQFQSNDTRCCVTVMFGQVFQTTPVVLAAVTSVNESDAVVSRLRHISTTDFQFQMQEQEANTQTHATETVSYIAWEPSSGTVDGLAFEVNRTGNVVTHQPYRIDFPSTLVDIPVFLADLQTANGPDPATLRWDYKDLAGVDVHVAEEQSWDSETKHTGEAVGYLLFSPLD